MPVDISYILPFPFFLFLGLVTGSFCNNWAFRLCRRESVVKGRSRCPVCGHTLGVRDLVPLVSFLQLGGRCRYCKAPISPRYPLTELVSALYYVSLYFFLLVMAEQPLELLRWAVLGGILLTLALVDLETLELPDGLILAGAFWFLLLAPFTDGWGGVRDGLLGGLGVGGAVLIFSLLMDKLLGTESFGGGDIKLIAMLGLHLGLSHTMLMLILSCAVGLISAVFFRNRTRAGRAGDETGGQKLCIPFGPSIVFAAWLTALIGAPFISWYLSLFM